jgi:hypothetical protein
MRGHVRAWRECVVFCGAFLFAPVRQLVDARWTSRLVAFDLPTGSIDSRATGPTDLASARVEGVFGGERGTGRGRSVVSRRWCATSTVRRSAAVIRRGYRSRYATLACGCGRQNFRSRNAVVFADGRWRLHVSDSGSVEQRPRASMSSLVGYGGTARSAALPVTREQISSPRPRSCFAGSNESGWRV